MIALIVHALFVQQTRTQEAAEEVGYTGTGHWRVTRTSILSCYCSNMPCEHMGVEVALAEGT